jgi:3-oxoacyl-[acyl-carrier protein] reductase
MYEKPTMLKNKVAIVTGSARGIGRGIALILAQNGSNVVLSDLDGTTNEQTAREIEKETGASCIAITCDISVKGEVDALIKKTIEKFGQLDILVNNAGIFPFKPFLEITESDWDKVLDINLKSIFLCSQAAAKIMKSGGKIVNISSIASLVGFEGLTHYCASKGGVNSFTRALALELVPKKINVNAIAPGAIETPGASVSSTEESTKQTINMIPWKRMGLPKDIAEAVIFLSSSGADYITGQVLVVDGGWTLR